MQALVAGALLETIGDPHARPSLPGDVHDAGRVSLLEPRRRIKLDRQGIIDVVACRADHGSPRCLLLRGDVRITSWTARRWKYRRCSGIGHWRANRHTRTQIAGRADHTFGPLEPVAQGFAGTRRTG